MTHVPSTDMELSKNDQKSLVTAIYKRLLAVQTYDYSKSTKIRAPITLLKPTTPSSNLEIEDYGLSKVC